MITKIAITGATGLLGQELVSYFNKLKGVKVFALSHQDIEISDKENIKVVLEKIKPDIIINTAAIIDVDFCEASEEKCYAVNRDGVKNLIDFLDEKVSFIQISSSEVFGRSEGFKIEGYTEDEEPKPESVYQKSKAEAEEIVKKYPGKWYIARAGWLFGKGRETFVDTVYKTLQEGKEIVIIEDQWRSPTWTRDFAQGLSNLLEAELTSGSSASGIYHVVNEVKPGEVTLRQIVEEIAKYLGIVPKIRPVLRKDFFKVPRAPSNVLKNTKLPPLPYWRDSLKEYLKTSKIP